jgi:epoxyqueuosine reductase QueG
MLAGLGFIGINNLLITAEYGCAFSMCTVLTDAPVSTERRPRLSSKCGSCEICRDVCAHKAIHGFEWSESGGRDAIVDVFKCKCPVKCMVNCPYTLEYANRGGDGGQNTEQ